MICAPLGGAVAAMLVMLVVAGSPFSSVSADYATRIGEVRTLHLPDGSRAWLSSDSAIDVAYDTTERRIHLLKGEAWFDVRRAADRAFVVQAADVEAIAKGTAFSVTRARAAVSVKVTKGVVDVHRNGLDVVELTVGLSADLGTDAVASSGAVVRAFSEADALAWRQRKVAINDLSLDDAVAEIDRYRAGRIFLWGAGRNQPVSAILMFDRLDEGLDSIAASQGLSVVRLTPWLAIVR